MNDNFNMSDLLDFCRTYNLSSHPKKKSQLIRHILTLVEEGRFQEPEGTTTATTADKDEENDDNVEEEDASLMNDDVEDVDDEIDDEDLDDIDEDDMDEAMVDRNNLPRVMVMTKPRRNNTGK